MKGKRLAILVLVLLVGVSTASAEIVYQHKGWQVAMPSWATNQSGVTITEDEGAPDDVLLLEIFKVFQGQPGLFGDMPSVVMTFTQIDPDAVNKIVINDESVTNNTSVAWVDFHMTLVSVEDQAVFNKAETFPGGGNDLDLAQFSSYSWTTDGAGNEKLNFFDGTVATGDDFTPGSLSGAIVIDVDQAALDGQSQVIFKLKEYPTIPEPMTLSILAAGAFGTLLRKKRRG